MNHETLEKMRQLRLFGMYDAFKANLETSVKETLTADQFISLLIACEWDDRRNRSIERTIRGAGFRYKASVEQIDYSIDRGLDKNQVHRLAALDFIKEGNLINQRPMLIIRKMVGIKIR
ncbi:MULTISPECIES: ATP-binding protein [Elizabethkingia]|uniref:ATP-binding protein n=1 Tax=Elizabethkingia TaxID=308865 RepID=UPI000D5268E4|nr:MULTISPECIES: ATP-binding protein [Elizabethkingia]